MLYDCTSALVQAAITGDTAFEIRPGLGAGVQASRTQVCQDSLYCAARHSVSNVAMTCYGHEWLAQPFTTVATALAIRNSSNTAATAPATATATATATAPAPAPPPPPPAPPPPPTAQQQQQLLDVNAHNPSSRKQQTVSREGLRTAADFACRVQVCQILHRSGGSDLASRLSNGETRIMQKFFLLCRIQVASKNAASHRCKHLLLEDSCGEELLMKGLLGQSLEHGLTWASHLLSMVCRPGKERLK